MVKTGVYVCHCGVNIASVIDVEKVVKDTNAQKYLEKGSKKIIFVEDRIINYIV